MGGDQLKRLSLYIVHDKCEPSVIIVYCVGEHVFIVTVFA